MTQTDLADRMVDAALTLAAERGWAELTLGQVAGQAGASLAEAYRAMPTKSAILDAFMRRIDAEVLADNAIEEDSVRPRDRIFDVLMRRFDALQRHRTAVAAILRDERRDPVSALASVPQFLRSMRWMGVAAGLPMDGLGGFLRSQAIAAAWSTTLPSWLADDSPDLARTMAVLDRRLRWAERLGPLFSTAASEPGERMTPGASARFPGDPLSSDEPGR